MSKRKSLKPYQLFLIGLALLLPSALHLLPSMYAGILVWFGLLFWVIAIIVKIASLFKRSDKISSHTVSASYDRVALVQLRNKIANDEQYKAVVATVAKLADVPETLREVAKRMERKDFPAQSNGYTGIAWIDKGSGKATLMFTFAVFDDASDTRYWKGFDMPLVEINEIKSVGTSQKTLTVTDNFDQQFKLSALMTDDSFSFLTNYLKAH